MHRLLVLSACSLSALALGTGAAGASTGPALWSQAGCGSCHTLGAAGSTGSAGPNLDQLRPSSGAVAAQVTYGGGGMPSFSSSLSASQIDRLAAWVAASTGGSRTAGSTAAAPGMSARAVRTLQRDLGRLHYFSGPVTGFYGPLTTKAVKRFQRTSGLTVDGIWGPKSQAALKRRL